MCCAVVVKATDSAESCCMPCTCRSTVTTALVGLSGRGDLRDRHGLYDLVFGEDCARLVVRRLVTRRPRSACCSYGGVGIVSLLSGRPFLDYSALSHDPVHGQHMGVLLVELGVGITVFSIILAIYYALSGRKVGHERAAGPLQLLGHSLS